MKSSLHPEVATDATRPVDMYGLARHPLCRVLTANAVMFRFSGDGTGADFRTCEPIIGAPGLALCAVAVAHEPFPRFVLKRATNF
jgi:hypothetical protein